MIRTLLRTLALLGFFGWGQGFAQVGSDWKLKPALLVIDVQNEYLPLMADSDRKQAPRVINNVLRWFHGNGFPVIRVYHTNPKMGPKVDTPGFEFPADIEIKPEDPKVIKTFGSAFKKTELEKLLREKGVNTLFLCGLSATGCVLATWHGADDLGFKAFLLKDGLLSPNAAHTAMIQEICPTISLQALALLINSMAK